jgi:hypothetical protein
MTETATRDTPEQLAGSVQVGLDPTQIFVAGTGAVWTAPADTVLPATPPPIAPWINNGYTTEDGILFTFQRTVDQIKGWQSFDPLRMIVTEAPKLVKFSLMQATATNLILALGGGTVGTGGVYTPPDPKSLMNTALYISGTDGLNTWAFWAGRAMVTDNVEIPWKKSGEAMIPLTFTVQAPPAGADAWNFVFPTSFGTQSADELYGATEQTNSGLHVPKGSKAA